MATNTPAAQNKYSEQYMENKSYDEDFHVLTREQLGYDGQNLQRLNANNMAIKITEDGDVTYIGMAAPGTAQATAKWQCKKIDQSSGTVITWADGNADFDNVATNLKTLSYS